MVCIVTDGIPFMNTNQLPLPDAGVLTFLLALKDSPGWTFYTEELNNAIQTNISILKTYAAADIRYLQGEIAGMEAALRIVDIMIDNIRAENERRLQEDAAKAAIYYREHSETPYG